MKTGLTKKQKVTELFYNAKDPMAEIHTHDTALKKRLLSYVAKHPEHFHRKITLFPRFKSRGIFL